MTSLEPGQLPPWTLENNASMIEFIRSITLKYLPNNLKIQTDFYIGFKCILLLIGIFLISKLILSGRFWLVRIVQVPNGKLVCPNACEGLCMAACAFYVIDLFYRGFCLQWYWDNVYSIQRGMAILYSFRLFFLWLAGFIHLASNLLIWPLDPTKIKPIYWHSFLFGLPLAFLAAYLPFCIRARLYAIQMNEIFVPLLKELQQDPQGQVTQQTIDIANQGFDHVIGLWTASREYAIVALSFLFFILIGTICCGFQIISRAGKRYRQIKLAGQEIQMNLTTAGKEEEGGLETLHSSFDISRADRGAIRSVSVSKSSTQSKINERLHTASSTNSTSALTPTIPSKFDQYDDGKVQAPFKRIQGSKGINWRSIGHLRLFHYLLGFGPLRTATKEDIALVRYGRPTRHSIETVLKDFFFFSIAQFTCLIIVELVMAACAFLVIITIISDLKNPTRDSEYITPFARTAYIFFVLEIWMMVTVGSPLIVIMLWRQLFPIKVDFEHDIYTKREPVFHMTSKWKQFKSKSNKQGQQNETDSSRSWHVDPLNSSNRANATENSPSLASPKLSNKESFKGGANDIIIISGSHSYHDGSTNAGDDDEDEYDNPWSNKRLEQAPMTRDLCGIAGSDLGVRRIVLEALDSANKYPVREASTTRITSSIWQRAAAESMQNHTRQTSSSPPPPFPQSPKFTSTPLRKGSLRRQSQATLSNSAAGGTDDEEGSNNTSRLLSQSPKMLSRLGGSIRRGTIIGSTKEFGNSFSMNQNPTILNPPSTPSESARYATPHGLVQSRINESNSK